MTKCMGCGITLQDKDETLLGYTPKLDNTLCQRCFRLKNYNKISEGKNILNDDIIKEINHKNIFTFFLCDLLSLNSDNVDLYKSINTPKIFVLTKIDIIPNNIDYHILSENIKNVYGIKDIILISTFNNYNKKGILDYLEKKHSVLFSGPTSSGKSSLINYLFDLDLTVSSSKNTTQDFITIKKDGYTIIDAPGFNNENSMTFNLKGNIKPRTITLKNDYELCILDKIISFDKECNMTLFFPNDISFLTRKKKNSFNNNIKLSNKVDINIFNAGFIYIKDESIMQINSLDNIDIRKSVVK